MASLKADEVACPKCAETIKAAATKCKHCGHEFTPAEMKKRAKEKADAQQGGLLGCGILAVLGFLFFSVCSGGDSEESETDSAASVAEAAERKEKGFHCLSAWDGSHRDFTSAVKRQLRDPDSFEHESTRVTPVANGQHTIIMEFRSRNGFGGMNRSTAVGTFSNATCNATVIGID